MLWLCDSVRADIEIDASLWFKVLALCSLAVTWPAEVEEVYSRQSSIQDIRTEKDQWGEPSRGEHSLHYVILKVPVLPSAPNANDVKMNKNKITCDYVLIETRPPVPDPSAWKLLWLLETTKEMFGLVESMYGVEALKKYLNRKTVKDFVSHL